MITIFYFISLGLFWIMLANETDNILSNSKVFMYFFYFFYWSILKFFVLLNAVQGVDNFRQLFFTDLFI